MGSFSLAPVLVCERGAVDEDNVHERIWREVADFVAASGDKRGVA